jgi:hypothetical protein
MYTIVKKPTITETIRLHRLGWFGHVQRMEDRHAMVQWLRHCATVRKFAGSIPDGVTGIFH